MNIHIFATNNINGCMKKLIYLICIVLAFACKEEEGTIISVTNSSDTAWENEVAEIDYSLLSGLFEIGNFVITDKNGAEVPYQITYDNKLLLLVSVKAHEVVNYRAKAGTPQQYKICSYGKHYPERLDDIAWENDRIAFRTYGPALQATGERAFGYDIWVKRVSDLVVEDRYALELDPETVEKIKELRAYDPESANKWANDVSYHVDHGNGLDYYSVGPTLGAGTSALLNAEGAIVYPYCYQTYKILDNGPLRFTVKLTYNPFDIDDQQGVVETRIISLDAGSQLNKIKVAYKNLSANKPIATGIVLHEPSDEYVADADAGFIAYAESTHPENGQTFVGAVFPDKIKETKKAEGHVVAISDYKRGSTYTYYAGGGWSKWGFNDSREWFTYIRDYANKVREPLSITVQ